MASISCVPISAFFFFLILVDYVVQSAVFITPIYVFFDYHIYSLIFFIILVVLSVNRIVFAIVSLIREYVPVWYYIFFWVTRAIFSSSLLCVACIVIGKVTDNDYLWRYGIYALVPSIAADSMMLGFLKLSNDISKESLEHLKESSYFTSASFRIKLNGSLKSLLTELVLRRRLNALDIGREVKCDENVIENVKTVFVQKQFNLLVIEKRKLLHVALRCWKKNPEDVVGKCVTIWPEINAMRGDVKRKLKPALEATNFYRYVSSLNKLGLLRPSKIYNFAKAGEHGIYVNFECFSKPDNIEEIEYAESSVEVRFYFY
ncbi:hypothetical protein QR680_007985 [Steinernema hermaphroditum]|uniref:Uncharacterized protein n=1 Tax=Steinernema hermaphroditum TaxID=289476 RepID=A0AA39IEY2_9BILA|nr:hypothetical protein QR680_007985 [Steinernema hermaphroditum]